MNYKKIIKLFFVYTIVKAIIFLITFVFSLDFFSIPNLELSAANDLSFNDFHYSIRKNKPNYESDKIVIINSGDLASDSFRLQLAQLIKKIDLFNPKVVGVDINFSIEKNKLGTKKLIDIASNIENVIWALDINKPEKLKFKNALYGEANFAEHFHTIRRYPNHSETFSAKIAMRYLDRDLNFNENETFIINYLFHDYEIINADFESLNAFSFSKNSNSKLPALNARTLFNDENNDFLNKFLENKIILIGHLGSTALAEIRNDMEDKFAVPIDTNMLFRQLTMPGILIHANAINNLIHPETKFKTLSDENWFLFIEELLLILYLFFLLNFKVGKIINVLILLAISVPLLYVVLFLMEHKYYIELGTTLLQLLIFEEIIESLESVYPRIKIFINKKLRTKI
jgi:CHASE2 domain-containing sensor protein